MHKKRLFITIQIIIILFLISISAAHELLVECEAFSNKGGWVVDQQFTHIMGSSYILAHGMGVPVADAKTTVQLPAAGDYRVWVRTKDWVPEHADTPGKFQITLNNTTLPTTFGTNKGWDWVDGGTHSLSTSLTITLHDLTGFEGRCDALYFTTDPNITPPNDLPEMTRWRRVMLGLPEIPELAGTFDVVVIGGGMAGTAAAITAARGGSTVAFIQDRPVLGGNASSDVRVHTLGETGFSIVDEIDGPKNTNVEKEAVEATQNRLEKVQVESNISLFLSTRAFAVQKQGNKIVSVDGKHIETGKENRFKGNFFIDCTGDGWIAYWAGARYMMGREASSEFNESLAPAKRDSLMMGSTIFFKSADQNQNSNFPAVPWAMDVAKDRADTEGHWYYEFGLGMDPFPNAEYIRDHLFRAIYGMFSNAKKDNANVKKKLIWMGYIMGKRESRRIVGDYILTENDIRNNVYFHDAIAYEQRDIDLHLPKPNHPLDFITKAEYTKIPRYTIPFRTLYSIDFDNLLMAGRCMSISHVGLGSPRVMNTGGQMGAAAGFAAALCKKYQTTPRGIYERHIIELQDLLKVPKNTVLPAHTIIMDNKDPQGVQVTGSWESSVFNKTYHGPDYLHDKDQDKGQKRVDFKPVIPANGKYTVYTKHAVGDNRATNVPIHITSDEGTKKVTVNQKQDEWKWVDLGTYRFSKGGDALISIRTDNTNGHVIGDAIALVQDSIPTGTVNYIEEFISYNGNAIHAINRTDKQLKIQCLLAQTGEAKLAVYTLKGKKIQTIAEGHYAKGIYTFFWSYSTAKIAAGNYIIRLYTQSEVSSKKIQIW